MAAVANPNKVKDIAKVDQAVAKWGFAYNNLPKEFGEELSDRMQIATVTNPLPLAVRFCDAKNEQ